MPRKTPQPPPPPAERTTTIRLRADLHEGLSIYCVKHRTSINAVVNALIEKLLDSSAA